MTESAQPVLPEVERTARQKWITAPTLQKMEQRRLTKGNVALYNLLDRLIKQDCRTAKETMLTEQCQVIEQLDAAHKSNLMHSQIKLVTGRKRGNNTTTCIEDKNGDIIMEKDEILSRWSEYIGELYNDDNIGDMPDIAAEVESPITRREVQHALRGKPEKKSPGPDGFTTEMFVAAGEVEILELTELSNMIHNQGLNYYCEHSSLTTSRAVSMDPMPSTSNSASSSTSCSTTKPFVTTALVTVPMSSSITESFNHTTYSTATVPALTNDVSVSTDSRNNTTFTPTTVNTASITTTIQPHVTSQSVTGPLCNTIITSADVHKSADDKTIPPSSDSPDLQAVSCIPLPEGDSFSCDTHIPPSTSTQAATRTNKPIVALSDKPEIKIKIKSKIPKSRANGSITSLDKTTPAKARIDNYFGAISSIKRKLSPGKNADTVKDDKHTPHEI